MHSTNLFPCFVIDEHWDHQKKRVKRNLRVILPYSYRGTQVETEGSLNLSTNTQPR